MQAKEDPEIYFEHEVMAQTMEGRNINLLSISSQEGRLDTKEAELLNDSNLTGSNTSCFRKNKMIVMFSARVHPGEPNGSLIMQQMLLDLARQEDSPINYLVIPMINVDGVVNGNFRTSFSGRDLNRMYGKKAALCPEVQLVTDLLASHKLIGVVDLHGHSAK